MFCANCGKKLEDHLKFCTGCGTPVAAPAQEIPAPVEPPVNPTPKPQPAPASAPAPAPKPRKVKQPKKAKPLAIILPIIAVVVVLVIGLVLAFVTGIFDSDETAVMKGFAKSALAYKEASEEIALPKLAEKGEVIPTTQSFGVKIDTLYAMPELEGIGANIALDTDLEGREIGLTLTPRYANTDILDAEILLRDAELFVSIPQIVGDRVYMANTETIGAALVEKGYVYDEEAQSFGFNLFDLIDIIKEATKVDEAAEEKLNEALRAFAKTLEAEKIGKESVEVNEKNLKCTGYEVVIPQDAMENLFEEIEDLSSDVDIVDLYIDLLSAIGMPDYLIDEVVAQMDMANVDVQAFDVVYDVIDEIGDIELEVYLHKGYVAAIVYETSVDGSDLELTVNLGGGKNYVDNLRVELIAEDAKIVLESTGDHTSPDGVFTDETTIKISSDYSDTIKISSELYYEPNASEDNFSWNLDSDGLNIELAGQITADEKNISVQLDELDVTVDGQKMVGLEVTAAIGEYQAPAIQTSGAIEVLHLSEEELYEELMIIEETAMGWAEKFMATYPELVEMLEYMM